MNNEFDSKNFYFKYNKFNWRFSFNKSENPFPFPQKDDHGERIYRAVALGAFNGLHLGHRAVIYKTAGANIMVNCGGEVEKKPLVSAVLTFEKDTFTTEEKGEHSKHTLIPEEKQDEILNTLAVNELISLDFESVRNLSPEEFVRLCLVDGLCAKRVCCGAGYRFGKNGSGDVKTLAELCKKFDIELVVADAVEVDGELVSTTRIRKALALGDVRLASKLLGYSFGFNITVVDGQHLGRKLGTPTINQPLPLGFAPLKFGVYASAVIVDGKVRVGVTNIGNRPTVGSEQPISETWIRDYEGDLYGMNIPVFPVKFLREEKKFDSIELLKNQIYCDAKEVEQLFSRDNSSVGEYSCVLFDFDDTIQNRKKAFSLYSSEFVREHFPKLSPIEVEHRAGEMVARNLGGYVDYIQYMRELIELWGWENAPEPEQLVVQLWIDFPQHTVLIDGAVDMLEQLKKRGYKVGIITNGPLLSQSRKMDFSCIRNLFDIVVVASEEGLQKPDPEVFKRTAYKLGLAENACLFVGDHPINDIKGAALAGMDAVFFTPIGNYLFDNEAEIFEGFKDKVKIARSFDDVVNMLK